MLDAFIEHPVIFSILITIICVSIVATVGIIADSVTQVRVAKHSTAIYSFMEEETK